MNSSKRLLALIALLLGLAVAPGAFAQTLLSEDFTGTTSSADSSTGVGNWLFFNGACLTAGTSTSLVSPATSIPACTAVLNSYYVNAKDKDQYLVGGNAGFLGSSAQPSTPASQAADPDKSGALRFTNGKPYGHQERGAIVSTNAYSTSLGIQVTFKTVTYDGTGADGISFYLMDGCAPVAGAVMPPGCASNPMYPASQYVPAIGATGGSLAYSCSNTNGPAQSVTYDGLTGAYLGLGIDEYGNFLNQGDNTASGFGFVPGRIGLRGAGSISWPSLNTAYGTNPNNSSMPFYPPWLNATCSSGTFDSSTVACEVCPAVASTNSTVPVGTTMVTTATSTTTTYASLLCTNTMVTTITTANDVGCTLGGSYTYYPNVNGVPLCAKCPSGTYDTASDSSHTTGICWFSPKTNGPPPTCSGGQTLDVGLGRCLKASVNPTVSSSFTTTPAGSTQSTSVTTNVPSGTVPYTPNVTAIQAAIQKTCSSGRLWNYATSTPTDAGPATLKTDTTNPNPYNTAGILDYPTIPTANFTLGSSYPLFNGGATTRGAATTIYYNLKITNDGLLSLSFAYGNGGNYLPVITNKSIQSSNGLPPSYVRFGFAGSTGGSTNVHEIMCFKSAPATQSASSAGVNEKQSAKVDSGTFAYFAYYDQHDWVGRVTATALLADKTTGVVSFATDSTGAIQPTWDASCLLTGVAAADTCSTGVKGLTKAMDPTTRIILTNNNGGTGFGGAAFEWGGLSSAQQTALQAGDPDGMAAQYRVNYLRGDRTNEVSANFTCTGGSSVCFRQRASVLGDIVDSSPTWVGPPQSPYTATWKDKLYPMSAPAENAGTQTYLQYVTAQQSRPNVVYVGSNDGMMHGFRSGSYDNNGVFSTATTLNDGLEVIAYVPGSLLLSATTGGACASMAATGSVVQNIHGVTPSPSGTSSGAACLNGTLDFSSPQYGHNFYVDATPGTGDLYYANTWHTWLVSGLGAGGAAIFALDVTNPTPTNFTEGNAGALVMGEWNPSNLVCQTDASASTPCTKNLGATYGTPLIRRLHDGRWAVIFGNGYGSVAGDAGIFVMTVDPTGDMTKNNFYYLSTGTAGTNNGIGYVTAADLDGDHVTDYVYAGDLNGNLWRFDLTDSSESNWKVNTGPMFKAVAGQPITTAVTVSSGATTAGGSTIIIAFGTGSRTQFTNALATQYATTATQSLYGVWDWNMMNWNGKSATQYAALAPASTSLAAPYTLARSNLLAETFHLNNTGGDTTTRDIGGTVPICWAGSSTCSATPQFGWYLDLIGAQEQIVYNPQLLQGVFTVNSLVPANNQATSCVVVSDTGFTYAISVMTGAAPPNFFVSFHDTSASGVQTNAVGTSFPVTSSTGAVWLVSQTVTNQPILTQVNPGANGKGRRLTWVQLR